MKRFFSVVLIAVLLVTLLPVRGNAEAGKKLVALTFDDGPSKNITTALLDGLKERNVQVTFFALGSLVSRYPEIVKRAYEDGHEIGSHSWDHPELTSLSNSEVLSQFSRAYTAMDAVCGTGSSYLVRAPYGSTSTRVRGLINRPLIDWAVDTRDWEVLNTYTVRDNMIRDSYDGAIILCHDLYNSTVNGVLMAIDEMLKQGYEFVTVSELFRRRGVELENGKVHYNCRPTGVDYGPIPTPVISCAGNGGKALVSITSESNAPIYYTTDGTVPNQNAAKYTGPFLVNYGTEIKAVSAYKLNGSRSQCAVFAGNQYPCPQPQINISGDVLSLECSAPGAQIYYTLDGSRPSSGSGSTKLYRNPIKITPNTLIRAVAGGGNYVASQEAKYYFTKPMDMYDVSVYRSDTSLSAPKKEGLVFAGWYSDLELTQPLGQDVYSGNAYAKFVDEDVLSVKWQLGSAASNGSRNIRLLTSVDSLNLSLVGFDVETSTKIHRDINTNTVYTQIFGYTDGNNRAYQPSIFCAASKYFMVHTLTGIPQSEFNTAIKITPKWTTLDGTQVVGTPLTIRISDAITN